MRLPAPLTPAWGVLQDLAARRANFDLPAAFAADPDREQRYTRSAAGLRLDLSRQCIDESVMAALTQLLDAVDMRGAIDSMWRGELINNTEQRAAWHVQLRRPAVMTSEMSGDLTSVTAEVLAERRRMLAFVEEIRASGAFDTVINIGIGGSDLGPAMAVQALRSLASGPKVHFVSNVDGVALHDLLQDLDPARTLFIICSKTFTTQETLANAERARAWILEHLGESAVPNHFAAVSVNAAAMDRFGIAADRRFAMWDWVGGRYSVWSAVGISLAMAVGSARFDEFLAGAHAMDEHFRTAEWSRNLPALLGLVGVWNTNFLAIPALAILPYSDRLARWPAFLQQLEMESNGKSVLADGSPALCATAPILWGAPGNDAQHSFYQLLHQGSLRSAMDILMVLASPVGRPAAQRDANLHALAQVEAFALGNTAGPPHRRHRGGRPQSLLVMPALTPATLGSLIALYEHKVFVQSVIWGINAFDQFGVELGKKNFEALRARHGEAASGAGDLSTITDWLRRCDE